MSMWVIIHKSWEDTVLGVFDDPDVAYDSIEILPLSIRVNCDVQEYKVNRLTSPV